MGRGGRVSAPVHSVTIVSAFGRGERLATLLKRKNFDVTLLDATEALKPGQVFSSGPFPLVSGVESFADLESTLKDADLPRGLTVWTPEGPLEFKGPMSEFLKEQNPAMRVAASGDVTKGRGFEETWLGLLLSQLTSPWMTDSTDANRWGTPFGLKGELSVLNNSTFAKALLKGCQDEGVEVVAVRQLRGVETQGPRVLSLQIGADGESRECTQVVWLLTSSETQRLNPEVAEKLFPKGVLEPDWQWVRMDLRSSVGPWWGGLPQWMIVVEDIYLPWTHANCFVLRRGVGGNWEAWLKVPFHRLQDPKAWYEWARQIEIVLLKRLPHAQWICDEASLKTDPQGTLFDSEKRGWKAPLLNNLFYVGPETLKSLDLASWLEACEKLIPRLEEGRNREMKKGKGARSDQALHAP